MTQETILYLHGFASSGQGAKAQYFREQFARLPQVAFQTVEFNPTPADFEYMTLTGLINRLRQYLLGQPPSSFSFIASSLGALVGLHYAHRFGGVRKMLLLAPALAYRPERRPEEELRQWQGQGVLHVAHYAYKQEVPLRFDFHLDGLRYLQPVPPAAPTIIVHGRQDEVVAIEHSREYAAHFPDQVYLVEVDADHQLSDQLAFIWQRVQSFLLSDNEPPSD